MRTDYKTRWRKRDRKWILNLEMPVFDWWCVYRIPPGPRELRNPITGARFSTGFCDRLRRACVASCERGLCE